MCPDVPARHVCRSCGTLSAYDWSEHHNLGCAAARRPQANGCNRFAVLMLSKAASVDAGLPRSGCTQQPGVAAQRRTPGSLCANQMYAEGVPQLTTPRKVIPTRTVRQTRRRTFETGVATHPDRSQFDDAPAGSVCSPSRRPHGKGLLKRHRNLAAIESWRSEVSTTSKTRVSTLVPDRRLTTFSKADKGYGRDPQRLRPVVTGCRGYGMRQRGMRGVPIAGCRYSGTVCGVLSKTRGVDKSAQETGPSLLASLFAVGHCGTLSAFTPHQTEFLGCAATRRPQANECNRFAVLILKMGEAHCV